MSFRTVVDNEALRVLDIRLSSDETGPLTIRHEQAILVGMEDGSGYVTAGNGEASRHFPVARGRVDWLPSGEISVHRGQSGFGGVALIEVRNLPSSPVAKTFGDRIIHREGDIVVYEEIIGPSNVRRMHNHGPRLVLCLSDIDLRNTLPGGELLEVKRKAGAVSWNPTVVTHEVFNVGAEPFWCVCVEHA